MAVPPLIMKNKRYFLSLLCALIFFFLIYFVIVLSPSPSYIKIVTTIQLKMSSETNAIIAPIYSQNIIETNKFVGKRYIDEIYP
jgi:hypothetical protein